MNMRRLKKAVFGVIPILLLIGLILFRTNAEHNSVIDPLHIDGEITIKDWSLIGPFKFAAQDLGSTNPHFQMSGLNHDYLKDIGYSEDTITSSNLQTIEHSGAPFTKYKSKEPSILFAELYPNTEYAVIYAVAVITSISEGDIGVQAGSDDGLKLWINGQVVIETSNTIRRALSISPHAAVVHLRKGKNLILAKIDQKRLGWAFKMSLLSPSEIRSRTMKL